MFSSSRRWLETNILGIQILDWLCCLVLLLSVTWALWKPGLFFIHDTLQIARVTEMLAALRDGHWPPRWSQHFGYGYGIPLFQFYAPLPYYVGAIVMSLGFSVEFIFKTLLFIPSLVTVFASYMLGRKWFSQAMAFLATSLIVLAPYRALNLYVRGAVSESWGMMFFPLIIMFIFQTAERKKWSWLGLALSIAGLSLSHNIATLLFLPFSLFVSLFAIFQQRKSTWLQSLKQIIGSYVLGIGLCMYYVGPAFLEKQAVSISAATDAYYSVFNHFIYIRQFFVPFWGFGGSQPGLADELSFFLGTGFWISLIAAAFFAIWGVLSKTVKRNEKVLWLGIWTVLGAGAFFLTTGRSALIWQSLPMLEFVQFPWRFLSVATFFSALSIASLLSVLLESAGKRWLWLVWLLSLGIIITQAGYFRPKEWLTQPETYYFTDQRRMDLELGPSLKEYLPITLSADPVPSSGELLTHASGISEVIPLRAKVQEKEVQVTASADTLVTWQVAAFPGWNATLDGKPAQLQTSASGLLTQNVPAGSHNLRLRWGSTTVRTISDSISLVTLGVTLFVCVRLLTEESRTHGKKSKFVSRAK